MSSSCRVVVLISGNGSNLQAIIDGCDDNLHADVVGVISNKPDAYGLIRAHHSEIDTSCVIAYKNEPRNEYDARLLAAVNKYQPDLIVLAGFMRILTDEFVSHFLGKMINIHPSLLPKYPGLNTHQRAIDAGDEEHGVSVHFVTAELDGGPVILQAKVPIFDGDTIDELAARVHQQEHKIYPLVVKWLCEKRLEMVAENQTELAKLDGKILSISGYANDE